MQRTMPAFVSMVALVVAASACGSGGGNAAGSFSNSSGNDRPSANGWDPFASPGDSSQGGADLPGCAGETTATASEILDAVRDPICELAARCPAQPANSGGSPGAGTQDMSAACSDILDIDKLSKGITDKGIRGVCELFDTIIQALKDHPECDPPIQVPQGICLDAVRRCLNDIVAFGCTGAGDAEPASCKGISFGSGDQTGGTGGSGQGGSQGKGGQGQGGQSYGGQGYGGQSYGGQGYGGFGGADAGGF